MTRVLPLLILALASAPALAQQTPERRGALLADTNCASCHAVGLSGSSPHAAAPPFRFIARKYKPDDLAEAFAEGIVVGHKDMPEFQMNTQQIGDMIAYFKVLANRGDR